VDTHALIWYLLGDKKLSKRALAIFRAAECGETRLLLPAIVMAELYFSNDILSKQFFKFLPFDHHHILYFDRDAVVPE
jgi:hypothetical protein